MNSDNDDKVNNVGQKEVEKNNAEGNNKLPNTSTQSFNIIVLGLLLIIVSAVLYFLAKRREVK